MFTANPKVRKDNIFWRLIYPDGQTVDEPLDGGSIKNAWAGAQELHIVHRVGKALVSIKLNEFYRVKDTSIELEPAKDPTPIFYRIRGIDVTPDGKPKQGGAKTLSIVFGRALLEGSNAAVNLWTLDATFKVIDCPPEALDLMAISEQIDAHQIALAANDRAGNRILMAV